MLTGKGAQFQESGAVNVAGGSTLKLGPDFANSKGNVTYTVTNNSGVDGAGLSSLINTISTTSKETVAQLAKQFAPLAEQQQTTDEDRKNKSVLWIALAAVVGFVAIRIWSK